MAEIRVLSFGYGHGQPPPTADITVDVRPWFRDPHTDQALRELTGHDQQVIDKVMSTPGVEHFADELAGAIVTLTHGGTRPPVLAVGCVGGRHRAVVIAERVAKVARWCGYGTEVEHLHVDRPVIDRPTGGEPGE